MKKIYLLKVKQHGTESYVGSAQASILVRMATRAELTDEKMAQRPIDEKRLGQIAGYIANDGTISTSIVIGTVDDRIKIFEDKMNGLYYAEFPENEKEFENFKDAFNIMDGQHRLFSFLNEYVQISEDEDYQLVFNMYIKPTLKERRLIFKNTNEAQKPVASNLLQWFRAQLNMMNEKEAIYHGIVELLNTEDSSPLKGRIIMGAEKIPGGYKAEQIINLFSKYEVNKIIPNNKDNDKIFKMISAYLEGWEKAIGTKLAEREKKYEAFSKIAGLRFMVIILETVFNKAMNEKQKFTKEFVADTIKTTAANCGIDASDIFDKSSQYLKDTVGHNPFAGETVTTAFAKDWGEKIKTTTLKEFNPLD